MNDTISRQSAIGAMKRLYDEDLEAYGCEIPETFDCDRAIEALKELPSVQPTLYGYDVDYLVIIAEILRREKMYPEKVMEVLTDVSRIVALIYDEFEESLKKAVEQCMT